MTLSRLRDWARYQYSKVRSIEGHHPSRIPTKNGIEEDSIGNFARSFSFIFRKKLSDLGEEQIDYLVATILRALRYRIRANIAELSYQPHVMRRDFVLRYDFHASSVSEDYTRYVINLIRGIPETIRSSSADSARVQLLDFKVPLLGGKLWKKDDIDRYHSSWIEFVADRIEEYREKPQILRNSIGNINDEEDVKKLERDFEIIQKKLLEACGLKHTAPTEIENALMEGGLATASSISGLPNVRGLLVSVTPLVKRKVFSRTTPLQQLVYKEFLHGWQETK